MILAVWALLKPACGYQVPISDSVLSIGVALHHILWLSLHCGQKHNSTKFCKRLLSAYLLIMLG